MLRTALQHKIGPYAPELPHTSDYEMWMRCALHSNIGFIRAVQGYYRLHGSNMSTAYHADPMRDWREAMHAVEKIRGRRRVVLRGVLAYVVVVGNPARPLVR